MILKILTLFTVNVCNNNVLMFKFDLRNINSWCIDIKKSINNNKKKIFSREPHKKYDKSKFCLHNNVIMS